MRDLRRQGRRPPLIVIENVVGLLHGSDFSGLCEALAQLDLRFGAMLIDARWFVPQSRPRVFVIAAQQQGRCGDQSPKGSWFPPAVRRAHSRLTADLQRRWIWWSLPQPVAVPASINRLIEADPPDARWLASDEVGRLCGMMTAANQAKLRQALSRSEPTVGFLYRRTRDGCQRPELRFDGLAGCLRTPGGGSSRQTVVDVQRGQVRMRLLTGREAARLMGAPDAFALPDNYNDAYHAMGDGVAVPAVEWLSENLLRPLSATQP
jgi:DNA (cytosine-5)-methyltransferase 1